MKLGDRIQVVTNEGLIVVGVLYYIDDDCLDMTDEPGELFSPFLSDIKSITVL